MEPIYRHHWLAQKYCQYYLSRHPIEHILIFEASNRIQNHPDPSEQFTHSTPLDGYHSHI